jgi:hypothetical protein
VYRDPRVLDLLVLGEERVDRLWIVCHLAPQVRFPLGGRARRE